MADFTVLDKFNRDKAFTQVNFGANAPLLEVELNELQKIQTEARADVVRQIVQLSGAFTYAESIPPMNISSTVLGEFQAGTASYLNKIGLTRSKFNINGYLVDTGEHNVISLDPPPASNTRTDLVFMEVWFEEVSYTERIKKYGGSSSLVTNDIMDTRIGAETSRRTQLKWRFRSVPDIDFSSYPKGINSPSVKAQKVDGVVSDKPYVAASLDEGLFIAGTGSFEDKEALGTTDGYTYAIPLLKVSRKANTAIISAVDITDIRSSIVSLKGMQLVPTVSTTRNTDNSIATMISLGKTYSLTYNADGSINTISDGIVTKTISYIDGELGGIS